MENILVKYLIILTREEAIKLIFDNEKVETITSDSNKIALMGSGTHKFEPDYVNGGLKHIFFTNIEIHNRYVWVRVVLTKRDDGRYDGVITFEQ